MSKMADLDYDIELRACDYGMSPKEIADELEIPVTMVLRWFIANGLSVKGQKDWTEEAKQRLIDDIFSPYETVNS
jgi:hypothetical protein